MYAVYNLSQLLLVIASETRVNKSSHTHVVFLMSCTCNIVTSSVCMLIPRYLECPNNSKLQHGPARFEITGFDFIFKMLFEDKAVWCTSSNPLNVALMGAYSALKTCVHLLAGL